MKYRHLPRGNKTELFSVVGLGMGSIQECDSDTITAIISKAMENGINYFDLCGGANNVYYPIGRAIAGKREKVFLQMHFGAVYNADGEYSWSRDRMEIQSTFDWELEALDTTYADIGFLHCADSDEDIDEALDNGIIDLIKEYKSKGIIRHIGFSSHTPSAANRILDMGIADMMMFSINPAYDHEKGDEYGAGTVSERSELLRRCQAEGVGVAGMKTFFAGKLLDAKTSPFGKEMTVPQCIHYSLDRPAVLTVVPGVQNMAQLDELLKYPTATKEEKDYSILGSFSATGIRGSCVYCNHCQPCPAGIDVGLVNRYYDLALVGDKLAAGHYDKLSVKADACIQCGHCVERCPFKVPQQDKMQQIAEYFAK